MEERDALAVNTQGYLASRGHFPRMSKEPKPVMSVAQRTPNCCIKPAPLLLRSFILSGGPVALGFRLADALSRNNDPRFRWFGEDQDVVFSCSGIGYYFIGMHDAGNGQSVFGRIVVDGMTAYDKRSRFSNLCKPPLKFPPALPGGFLSTGTSFRF